MSAGEPAALIARIRTAGAVKPAAPA
jgi:hypothetical protein